MSDIEVRSPVDGRVVGAVPNYSADEVDAVVGGLRATQTGWGGLSVSERVGWLSKYRDWLLDHEFDLAKLLQSETGKPWAESNLEIPYIVDAINYYTRIAAHALADRRPRRHGLFALTKRQLLVSRPYPVVGVITPWNFPLGLSLLDTVPALLAGAAVLVKPSEVTPLTVVEAIDGWRQIGAPSVLAAVTGAGQTGAAIVDRVDFVQFTGSTRTGKAIAQAAAQRLIPCGLELGGKDAMIVLDDADMSRAANAAVWGAIANAGQMCTSVERVYVEEPVYEAFVAAIIEEIRKLRIGADDQSYRSDVGPLITGQQVDIVREHLADAVAKGARIVIGGGVRDGSHFVEPTVLVDVDHGMLCMQQETFGPLLPVVKVGDEAEAIRLANDSPYGLSATVFSRDSVRAQRVARKINAGAVTINDVFANLFTLALPQGGWNESGLGTRNGENAITKFCRPQAIVTARLRPRREPAWYPYTQMRGAIMHRAARLINARNLKRIIG
ncbi:aldehyde dehydrogenase [Mycobacteroides stephanolepidis]|uniref:Aldehyde dehydrogenase n=1 Tax=[Mycobacterium] stephanolepidis TaxID=1520670 RepID=A0A1Z4EWE7_9MYCO|nr:aldehyde dehydrogenase family protein [[Mycobacterium] stephanolepidis]BAX97285.1 aldehyde dehydrogenase [[Mycobacterium] stephanolepidis]